MANELGCNKAQLLALLAGQGSTTGREAPTLPPRARIAPGATGFRIIEPGPIDLAQYIQPGVDLVGLLPATVRMGRELVEYALSQGWTVRITSGIRSAAYQAQLRARWDAGDRVGLRVRPAASSTHTRGEALDMTVVATRRGSNSQALNELGTFAMSRGYTWGGTWRRSDPVHFAIQQAPGTSRIDI